MSEHRTIRYVAESEYNAIVLAEPINTRLREAGWQEVSSIWSDGVPGYWEEEIWAHALTAGILAVIYERDMSLPILPSLQAAIDAAGTSRPDIDEAIRNFARLARQTFLPIGQEPTFMGTPDFRQAFMGAYLVHRLDRSPELLDAYRALPLRLRLEMERADSDAFFAKFAG